MVRIWVASLHQKSSAYESTLGFLFYKNLKFHFLGWIRTAAEPTATTTSAASGGSSEELLGPRPAIRKQGAADAGCRNPSACGGNREARLGQRSDFSRPRQGVAEKSASATRKARRLPTKNSRRTESSMRRLFSFCWIFKKDHFTYSTVYSKPYSSCSFLTAGSQSSMKVGA